MSRDLGIPGAPRSAPTTSNGTGPPGPPPPAPTPAGGRAAPPATRAARPGWRDPRLWLGVAIVAASVVAGSRVLAAADDVVSVWAVTEDAAPGARLDAEDLEVRRVRFAEAGELERYVPVEEELPSEVVLTRGVGAGELLPRGAIGSAQDTERAVLRIAVAEEQVPATVEAGAVVDVYLLDDGGGVEETGQPSRDDVGEPVLEGVGVLEAPGVGDGFSGTGNRSLDLAVTPEQARAWFEARAGVGAPLVSVVQVG